jgi:hypothetical protein
VIASIESENLVYSLACAQQRDEAFWRPKRVKEDDLQGDVLQNFIGESAKDTSLKHERQKMLELSGSNEERGDGKVVARTRENIKDNLRTGT